MTIITTTVPNLDNISNGSLATITGKNGFTAAVGLIPLLVNNAIVVNSGGSSLGNVQLTVEQLPKIIDDNFNKHVLLVNDGIFSGLKGFDYVNIPIEEKVNTGAALGFVGYNTKLTNYTANIVAHDISNSTIKFNNIAAGGVLNLFDVLPTPPFYIKLGQILDSRYFNNNSVYIEGTSIDIEKTTDISSKSIGNYTSALGVIPRKKQFITAYIDGIELTQADFSFIENTANIGVLLDGTENQIRTVVKHYTVPAIELGDNVTIGSTINYSVNNTSYITTSPTYNAALTANYIYKVTFAQDLTSNIAGSTAINITQNPIGIINEINTTANTIQIEYNEKTYPGSFTLANNKIYRLEAPLVYTPITLGKDRVIKEVPTGINLVRARNINPSGRKSPFVSKTISVNNSLIQKVENLNVDEELYLDTSQGVSVRILVSFDHILNQDVTNYEVAYRLVSADSSSSGFNKVLVPALSVDSDNKIRYIINNIDRGRASSVNQVVVRVTPVSSIDIRGISSQKTEDIIGKTASPQNILNLSGGQQGQNLVFTWNIPTNNDGTVVDLDLNEIEIRRISGTVASSDFNDKWVIATTYSKISTPAAGTSIPISEFGVHTYLIRTKDTSGNFSENIKGITIETTRPNDIFLYKVWSEDNPSGNVVINIPNENRTENNFPSHSNSSNGGLSFAFGSPVDNANGTSSGWATSGLDITDLTALDSATYQTQIRDVSRSLVGVIYPTFIGTQAVKTSFTDLRSTIWSGVSEISDSPQILYDIDGGGIGHILGNNNTAAATVTYSSINKTLVSGGTSGNVFAIWNEGQYSGDIANANSFALLAHVINANAVTLGATYYANGESTNSNNLPNITTNTASYKLVDLSQFIDESGDITFSGPSDIITSNIQIRFANSNPFYSTNGNVNVSVFTNSLENQGWRLYEASDKKFRYFQLKFDINNENPTIASFILDKINYTVELKKKEFSTTVNVLSNPQQVFYINTNFTATPHISLTPISSTARLAVLVDSSNEAANIKVFNSSSGAEVTDTEVLLEAGGI